MMIIKKKTSKRLKAIAILSLLLAFAVTALVGCNGESEVSDNQNASSKPSSESSLQTNASDTESSDKTSDSDTFAESSESGESINESSSFDDSQVSDATSDENSDVNDSQPETSVPSDESSNPSDESSEPELEIIGDGTKDSPYLLLPNEDMKLTTYEIPADGTHYYEIYRVGGLDLIANSDDLYIVCDGKKYTPKNGKLSFRVVNAMASEAIVFEVTNTSSNATSFELEFINPVGTYANPLTVKIGENYEVSLLENDEVGYYYKHIAEKDGIIRFKLTASADGFMAVTNNRNSAQRTSEDDGTIEGDAKYVEIEVQKGDELIINVGAIPNKRGKRPAIDITVSGEYK